MGTPGKGFSTPTLSSQYYVYYPIANGSIAYILTGVVQLDLQGRSTGLDYYRSPFNFTVPIPDLPQGKGLQLIHWAPFITLNSISNDQTATNAGWAVDDFAILDPGTTRNFISMQANLAVRDTDGHILRLGYQIHLLGQFADMSIPR